jgi:hypothetical protein
LILEKRRALREGRGGDTTLTQNPKEEALL